MYINMYVKKTTSQIYQSKKCILAGGKGGTAGVTGETTFRDEQPINAAAARRSFGHHWMTMMIIIWTSFRDT